MKERNIKLRRNEMGIIYKRWVNACNLKGFECDWEKWLKEWWFSRKCAGIESNWKFGIDWEKRESGPHREKDGERAGKRKKEGDSGISGK